MTNTVRAPNLPDLPTVTEAGYPGLTVDGLVGMFGPTGMSSALRDKITADVKAVADDTIKDRLMATGQLLNVGGRRGIRQVDRRAAQSGRGLRQEARHRRAAAELTPEPAQAT